MQSGNVLGTGAVSVLPATAAYAIFPYLHSSNVSAEALTIGGLWAASYVAIAAIVRYIKK